MIFCVEDDASIRDLMLYTLRSAGYETEGLGSGKELDAALDRATPELIMLDIMLPGEDGISILKRLKKGHDTRDIPVIMATAKGSEYDKVNGLDTGADDYLVKPFGMMEMLARVRALLRRIDRESDASVLEFGPITMDLDEHRVLVSGDARDLTRKEYEILKILLENPGHVFSREQLLDIAWGIDFASETRTVDVHVGTLRSKLGDAGKLIKTVRGVGYRLEVDS